MPISRVSTQDDRQLIRYLLGLLPDEEAELYDEQSIVDDDLAARLRLVENDLVDAYVRGTLDDDFGNGSSRSISRRRAGATR